LTAHPREALEPARHFFAADSLKRSVRCAHAKLNGLLTLPIRFDKPPERFFLRSLVFPTPPRPPLDQFSPDRELVRRPIDEESVDLDKDRLDLDRDRLPIDLDPTDLDEDPTQLT